MVTTDCRILYFILNSTASKFYIIQGQLPSSTLQGLSEKKHFISNCTILNISKAVHNLGIKIKMNFKKIFNLHMVPFYSVVIRWKWTHINVNLKHIELKVYSREY